MEAKEKKHTDGLDSGQVRGKKGKRREGNEGRPFLACEEKLSDSGVCFRSTLHPAAGPLGGGDIFKKENGGTAEPPRAGGCSNVRTSCTGGRDSIARFRRQSRRYRHPAQAQ